VSRRFVLLAALALAGGLASGCAEDVSPAVRVGNHAISNDDFLDEVEEWAHNPAAVDPAELAELAPGTLPQALVAQILQQRIDLDLHAQEFDELGLELTDAMRSEVLVSLFGDQATAEQALSGFSSEFADTYIDDVVKQSQVEAKLGLEYADWHAEALTGTDIEISSRYGTWDAETATITPPPGPLDPSAPADLDLGQ
jgi:hypothetical protein